MFDWDDLRCLLAVRRTGSMTRAAAEMRVDKATLGRRVSNMEEALGVRLLDHAGGGARMTEAGERAVTEAERVEALLLELEDALGGADTRGAVRLTLPAAIARRLVMPAVPAFRAAHPGIDLQLVVADRILLDLGRREAEMHAQADAVAASVGLGVVPCLLGDDDPGLVRVAVGGRSADEVWMAWPEELRDMARVRGVVEFVTRLWREHQPQLDPQ